MLVTNGGSEANFTAVWGLLEKGDHAAVMLPNYLQTWGLSRAWAAKTKGFYLKESRDDNGKARWALDVESFHRAVSKKTRLIVVTNPNNPTGAVLNQEEMDEIVRVARRARAWLLVDEIYRGAEVRGPLTPTFWGSYDKVLITSGLSRPSGYPGFAGMDVAPPKTLPSFARSDYTTLTPTILSDRLARIVMEPERREQLDRTRRSPAHPVGSWIHARRHFTGTAGGGTDYFFDTVADFLQRFLTGRKERSVLITREPFWREQLHSRGLRI